MEKKENLDVDESSYHHRGDIPAFQTDQGGTEQGLPHDNTGGPEPGNHLLSRSVREDKSQQASGKDGQTPFRSASHIEVHAHRKIKPV
jgi:hypothetical protein